MVQDANYRRVHQWLIYWYGRASKCENKSCQFDKPKRFEWALIKGKKYEKNKSNFMQLCCSCHRKYDFTEETRRKMSESRKGIPAHNRVPVIQLDLEGNILNEFKSCKEAAKHVNGKKQAFSMLKSGRLKTYKGYKWKFV